MPLKHHNYQPFLRLVSNALEASYEINLHLLFMIEELFPLFLLLMPHYVPFIAISLGCYMERYNPSHPVVPAPCGSYICCCTPLPVAAYAFATLIECYITQCCIRRHSKVKQCRRQIYEYTANKRK